MYALTRKLKEVLFAVLPVMGIVLLIHFTVAPLGRESILRFMLGGVFAVLGLTIFLFGVDQSIDPIGKGIGGVIMRSGKVAAVITAGLILGFFISYAEPDLHILAEQVSQVTAARIKRLLMVTVVSVGIGVMMTLAMMRILYTVPLRYAFLIVYGLIFVMSLFSSPDFLAIAFDASGATTGALTTPFMLALAAGVSSLKKDTHSGESDSFGLVGISSAGAIIGVLATGLIMGVGKLGGAAPAPVAAQAGLLSSFTVMLPGVAKETLMSLLPITLSYLFFQTLFIKQPKEAGSSILKGLAMSYVGLVLFLTGVNSGFMQAGRELGMALAALPSSAPLFIVSFLLGLVTVLAEPAVIVLTHQIEDVTGGYVKRSLVLVFMSLAVGLAILMAAMRVTIPALQLWMYLLLGFGGAVLMAFFTPDLFVGMAFDAGGVASGPMTATFSLAFIQGIAIQTPTADIVSDGFGMIAIVAMMPVLAVQTLGLIYRIKTRKK